MADQSRPRRRPHLDPDAAAAGLVARRMLDRERPARRTGDHGARFAAAAARPPDEGVSAGDETAAGLLATAPIRGMGRIAYSTNATFVLEFDVAEPGAENRPLRAVYKPARGERPLWDFPHQTLHFREMATYLVDAAIGFGIVPPTVLRDGPHGPGSVQFFVHAAAGRLSQAKRARLEARLPAVAALDALVNNADRKSSHVLVDESRRLRGIDHGLTFLPYPRQRTVLLELGGSPLPDDVAAAVVALRDDASRSERLRERLDELLDEDEVAAFSARLEELADDPVYPVLDPWDGRPFEWW